MSLFRGEWMLAAALVAAASGCESLHPRTVQIDAASGRFQSAQLTYQLDTGRLSQPVQTARIAAQQVSYQQLPSTPLPDRSHARLSVQYPHPRGRAGYALAEVVIESDQRGEKAGASAEKSGFQKFVGGLTDAMNDILPGMVYGNGVKEAWALDIPKDDLDQLVGSLANSGYFNYGPAPTAGVDVLTRLDGKVIRKNWRQVPELDAFIERVRHEGTLVSYVSPKAGAGAPAEISGGRNDSVAAYQQQLQRQQGQAGPPPQPYPIVGAPPPRQFGPPQPPAAGPMFAGQAPQQQYMPQQNLPPQNMPPQNMNQQFAPQQPWQPQARQGYPQQPAPQQAMPQQAMPQQTQAPAAPYGYPPQQFGGGPGQYAPGQNAPSPSLGQNAGGGQSYLR